jgi:23S rRNA (uracil1939-C5)-methyltransferase
LIRNRASAIADMFCGLGNFTLPIARSGASVLGIEGSAGLVSRGREAAKANGLGHLVDFAVANLFECSEASIAELGRFDKMLIDPPREGALELVKALGGKCLPAYCLCLVQSGYAGAGCGGAGCSKGYRLKAAGIVNMFPHTAHVESIALFERP